MAQTTAVYRQLYGVEEESLRKIRNFFANEIERNSGDREIQIRIADIAQSTGMSLTTVQKTIFELESHGELKVTRGLSRRVANTYTYMGEINPSLNKVDQLASENESLRRLLALKDQQLATQGEIIKEYEHLHL